jgi:hypothetical protein
MFNERNCIRSIDVGSQCQHELHRAGTTRSNGLDSETLEVVLGIRKYGLECGLRTMPALAAGLDLRTVIQRGGVGEFRVNLEVSFSSSLLIGSRPSANSVGTGFYHLLLELEFPRAPDPPNDHL